MNEPFHTRPAKACPAEDARRDPTKLASDSASCPAETSPTMNPFATRFIRAGAIGFHFPEGQSRKDLLHRLIRHRWSGQIVGHHGSGKTTLLRTLDDHWLRWKRRPVTFTLHDGQRTIDTSCSADWSSETQVIVDGFEQLSRFSKCKLRYLCHRKGAGLIVTAHKQQLGLPTLFRSSVTLPLAHLLVEQLTREHVRLDPRLVETCFWQCGGNLRETFLRLYDEHSATRCETSKTAWLS